MALADSGTGEYLLEELPVHVAFERAGATRQALKQAGCDVGYFPIVRAAEARQFRRLMYLDPESGSPELDRRIVELVKRYRDGASQRALADLAHVSKSVMGRILKGEARLSFDAADLDEILAA